MTLILKLYRFDICFFEISLKILKIVQLPSLQFKCAFLQAVEIFLSKFFSGLTHFFFYFLFVGLFKAVRIDLTTLTVARYYLETCILFYNYMRVCGNLMALACLLPALRVKDLCE